MNRASSASRSAPFLMTALACLASTPAPAQQDLPTGYEVTETNVANPAVAAENVGPVRMARFSLVQGHVNTRSSSKLNWAPAYINQPVRQGEQVYVPANSRAELQFDDGSVVRLGGGAFITMQTLYSDAQGEFTEVKLNDGLATWRLKNKVSVYQVDTPFCSVKAAGPARFRVGSRKTVEVAARAGNITVEDQNGTANLTPGQFVELASSDAPLTPAGLPPDDTWEHWNADRDHVYDTGSPISQRYLPSDIALVSPDLDTYGSWHSLPNYGQVWVPRVTEAGWRPYHHGHWVWVDPFGWTWVGDEPWGWAPYHYGTWVHSPYGWGWRPGPAQQCWSPAVVSFSSYNGSVAWAPLCPEEVRYPSRLAIGFTGGDWSALFSIGGCGAYYPGPNHVCYARAWNTNYINRVTYVTNYHGYGGRPFYASNNNSYLRPGAWTPRNARFGGGSMVAANRFGTGNRYDFVSRNNTAVFQRGRPIGIPGRGRAPAVGPSHVRPTLASLTPGRSFSRTGPPSALAARPLFRSALNPRVAGGAPAFGNRLVTRASGRPNTAARPGFGAAKVPGTARSTNRPIVPGTPGALKGNRGGSPFNRNPAVPASVQAARKTLGGGNRRNPAAGVTGRPTTARRANPTNARAAQTSPKAGAGRATNRVPTVTRRNPTPTPGQVSHRNQAGVTHRPNITRNTGTNRPNSGQQRPPPNRPNALRTQRVQASRPNNQTPRITRQPSLPTQRPRNNGSFPRGGFAAPGRQNRPMQSPPRNVSPPRNTAPRPNFGGNARPMNRPQAAPPRNAPPSGGANRPMGGGRPRGQ